AKMPNPKAAPWDAVKAKPDVKEITKNYTSAFSARKLLDQKKPKEAYAQAKSAAIGRTVNDAYPNWVLAKSAMATGKQKEAVTALQRAISSNEPVREIYEEMIFVHERGGQLESALGWTDKASTTFGEADRWTTHKIRLLRKLNRTDEANTLTLKCTVETPDWRQACQEANQTPALRAAR
ncbi:MAG: tetratricopeptide repeat protein, partial [Pyrinomonadaceae bacterium]